MNCLTWRAFIIIGKWIINEFIFDAYACVQGIYSVSIICGGALNTLFSLMPNCLLADQRCSLYLYSFASITIQVLKQISKTNPGGLHYLQYISFYEVLCVILCYII
mmetsp:Transcript_33131/g.43633  ORF Transcript_33131/g.43633 Transcript_33131/m.43633 type:complete len:106 (+) Transcript_33131:1434-1751(+)